MTDLNAFEGPPDMVKSRNSTPKTPPDPEDLIPTSLGWLSFEFTDRMLLIVFYRFLAVPHLILVGSKKQTSVDLYVADTEGIKIWLAPNVQ